MAIREFTDRSGVNWLIWQVVPTRRRAFPHVLQERRQREERVAHDRRRRNIVTPGLEGGWLCFEAQHEKRRLAPVPDDWETCSDEQLADYLSQSVASPRRIIDTAESGDPFPLTSSGG